MPQVQLTQTEITIQGYEINSDNELLLKNNTLSVDTLTIVLNRLKVAFPAVNREWLLLFSSVMKEEGYSDDDLLKAVSKVIKEETFTGAPPAIAKFCSQLNKVKLFSVHDIDSLLASGKDSWANYKMVHKGKNGVLFAKIADIERYNLKVIEMPIPIEEKPESFDYNVCVIVSGIGYQTTNMKTKLRLII